MKSALFVLGLSVFLASIARPQALPASKKTQSPPAAVKKTTATKTSPKTATKKGVSKGAAQTRKTVARRSSQQTPTPDRYKDIQQALAAKGYLKSEPTGIWDGDSIDALRRFQTDQKIDPTGKINAPSLIGLGLGPKFEDASASPPPLAHPADPATPALPEQPDVLQAPNSTQ